MRERSEVRSEPSVCFDNTGWEAAWCGHVEVDMWAILCRGMNQETGHWTPGGSQSGQGLVSRVSPISPCVPSSRDTNDKRQLQCFDNKSIQR